MSSTKFDVLTWLRGFAAFFVILNHALLASKTQYTAADEAGFFTPFDYFNVGLFAVYLFFALSGCTLTLSHSNKINQWADFLPFYIKRFFRIWPAFAISLVGYLLYIEFFRSFYPFAKEAWIAEFLHEYTLTNVFQYLSLTFNLTGPRGLFTGPYWSLPVEFQYYLMLPFALIFMKGRLTNILIPLLFGAVLYGIYYKDLIHVDRAEVFKMGFSFFGGVVMAKAYPWIRYRVPLVITFLVFMAVCVLMGLLANKIILLPESLPIINDKANIYGLFSVVMVGLALITRPIAAPSKLANFFTVYGEISYSIYLFHMMFVGLAVIVMGYLGLNGYLAKLWFVLCFAGLGSYFLSLITYRFIEQPSIKVGSLVAARCAPNR